LYGGGAHAYVVENAIKNYNCRTGNYIINKKFFVSYIYDDFLKKPFYITKAKFLNKEIDFSLGRTKVNCDLHVI
jgi:hypothetical protein